MSIKSKSAWVGSALALAGAGAIGVTVWAPADAIVKVLQLDAENQFSSAGVTWTSSGQCSDRNNKACTSFDQINQSTIDGAVTLKSATGCEILITGGTETGHAAGQFSHWEGYKVDLDPNDCLTNYIHANFHDIGPREGDQAPQYESDAGNIYADEGTHWDVLYVSS